MAGTRQPRRSPRPSERQRDPERTRARILAAAKVEFGAKGFVGARVSDIAARAGVNKQLISYYFDGKEGLYAELASQWQHTSNELTGEDRPLAEVVAGFAMSSLHDPDWARLMVWSNLSTTKDDPTAAQEAEFLRAQVAGLRQRQESGELPADLDPACVFLALFSAASATITLPRITSTVRDDGLNDEEFTRHYANQLSRLVRHLTDGHQKRKEGAGETEGYAGRQRSHAPSLPVDRERHTERSGRIAERATEARTPIARARRTGAATELARRRSGLLRSGLWRGGLARQAWPDPEN